MSQTAVENIGMSYHRTTRFRLDMLKNKVKRSLTESLESILSWDNKARGPPGALGQSGSGQLCVWNIQ